MIRPFLLDRTEAAFLLVAFLAIGAMIATAL